MWIIVRTDGLFVALSGSKNSYTNSLRRARTYASQESAERDLCPENEYVARVEDYLPHPIY